ncbi:hypothetical protein bcgnr5378_28770 [Bacillus cereus]|nr:hypothetical protein [Bacillus cereus]HDR8329066.1 hypothetical protein [Bacillus cereus]HDR8335820.1 hypothetical protein [Bacillus cereus]
MDLKEKLKMSTYWSEHYYLQQKKAIEQYEQDEQKEIRKSERECKTCFYLKKGGSLQAFTSYKCGLCDREDRYHNSRVPKYCTECADKLNICVRCGAEVQS